jgi:non-homologous end joining protein Ku
MAPRANCGYLRLSLVSCPIALYPAVAAGKSQENRHEAPAGKGLSWDIDK